jgi:hypothetical protein
MTAGRGCHCEERSDEAISVIGGASANRDFSRLVGLAAVNPLADDG